VCSLTLTKRSTIVPNWDIQIIPQSARLAPPSPAGFCHSDCAHMPMKSREPRLVRKRGGWTPGAQPGHSESLNFYFPTPLRAPGHAATGWTHRSVLRAGPDCRNKTPISLQEAYAKGDRDRVQVSLLRNRTRVAGRTQRLNLSSTRQEADRQQARTVARYQANRRDSRTVRLPDSPKADNAATPQLSEAVSAGGTCMALR
jgi:hypothetical protein